MFWNFGAQLTLQDRLSHQPNTNVAKNTILFIGDGMSISTVAAARTYLGKNYIQQSIRMGQHMIKCFQKIIGQLQGNSGEETRLSFEDFPSIGLSKVRNESIIYTSLSTITLNDNFMQTYCVDEQIADSACTGM